MFKGLTALVASEAIDAGKRRAARLGWYALAGVLLAMSAGFALAALHAWLAMFYGSIVASLIIAGGLALGAIFIILIAQFSKPKPRAAQVAANAALVAAPAIASRFGKTGAAKGVLALGAFAAAALLGKKLAD